MLLVNDCGGIRLKLEWAHKALLGLTGLFVIFTLAFFIGRSSAHAVISTQTAPVELVYETAPLEQEPSIRLNLNEATADELEALPGIGPVLAERILQWREEYGPFVSAEQIMDIEGIGEKKYGEIQDLIYVEDAA